MNDFFILIITILILITYFPPYTIGDIDDEKSHSIHCTKFLEGPLITSMKGHKVLETYETGFIIYYYYIK